MYIKQLIH